MRNLKTFIAEAGNPYKAIAKKLSQAGIQSTFNARSTTIEFKIGSDEYWVGIGDMDKQYALMDQYDSVKKEGSIGVINGAITKLLKEYEKGLVKLEWSTDADKRWVAFDGKYYKFTGDVWNKVIDPVLRKAWQQVGASKFDMEAKISKELASAIEKLAKKYGST